MNKPTVTHTCEQCGAQFEVPQGSRRRFCAECMAERLTAGGSKSPKRKEAAS